MADWNLPSLSSIWIDFLSDLKARDFDAISLGFTTILNPVQGMMRWHRATSKFQEYSSGTWNDQVLSVAGGGTGSNTGAGAAAALGLGTISTQNANNVTITGGTISGLASFSVNGDASVGNDLGVEGVLFTGVAMGGVQLTGTNGKIPALTSTYFNSMSGATITALTAANITAGGTLPVLNGANLLSLNAAVITPHTGYVPVGSLGSGAVGAGLLALLDNGTWGNVNMLAAARNESVSFSSNVSFTDTKDVDLSAFTGFSGVSDKKEIVVFMNHGSRIERTATGVEVSISWEVINTTPVVRIIRTSITGAGAIQAETINFTFWRVRVG